MKDYTLDELKNETCQSFGGNNCAFHQCMFGCALETARDKAKKKESEGKRSNDNYTADKNQNNNL